ncbi:hypothetical protein R3P38DRAFT_2758376 [Favolaschia claudopus]|uniref:Uncharacterized protein n=1 Tax=Favolaschia claudopus TaxID=2862362 RepID=A0AAW0EAX2_9AGAR
MANTSVSSSALSSLPSTPAPDSSLESYIVNDDYSGYDHDVFRQHPALQSPTHAGENTSAFVYPNPQGGSPPEEDADEFEADREANEEDSDSDKEYQLDDSSPIRPPPRSGAKEPLRREGFHSDVPLRLPPRADEPQLGGGYPRLEAEPLPPDQQPSSRLRGNIRASARANTDAIALHEKRAATTRAAEPPSAPPIASTSAAPTSAAPAADHPPPPRPTTPPPAPPPKASSRRFVDSPSKLVRSTSIEPGGVSIAQGRAVKPHSRAASVVPKGAVPKYTKKELLARIAAREAAAAEVEAAMGTVEEEENNFPPPPHSNLWETHHLPPPPNHHLPPPNYAKMPTPPPAEATSASTDPATLFDDDARVEHASAAALNAINDYDSDVSEGDPATPAVSEGIPATPASEGDPTTPAAVFDGDDAFSVAERAEGRSLSAIEYEVEEVDEEEDDAMQEVAEEGDDAMQVVGDSGGRLKNDQKAIIRECVTEVRQLLEVYRDTRKVPIERLNKALLDALSAASHRSGNGWNAYQAFATDPRNAVDEYRRFNEDFTSDDVDDLPQFTSEMLKNMYRLFKEAHPEGRAKEALRIYQEMAESEKKETLISRQRQFDKICEGFKSTMEDLDERNFNAIMFVVGRFVHDDLELGDVIATPALADSFSAFFKHPTSGTSYSNSDLLGVAKVCALVDQAKGEYSEGVVLPTFKPAAGTSALPAGTFAVSTSTSAKVAGASAKPIHTSAKPVRTSAHATAHTSAHTIPSPEPGPSTSAAPPAVVVKTEEKSSRHSGGKRAWELEWRSTTSSDLITIPAETEDKNWLQERFNSMSRKLFNIDFFSRGSNGGFPWHTMPRLLSKSHYRIVGWPDKIRLPRDTATGKNKGMGGWRQLEMSWVSLALLEYENTGYGLRLEHHVPAVDKQNKDDDFVIITHDYTLTPPTNPDQLAFFWRTGGGKRVQMKEDKESEDEAAGKTRSGASKTSKKTKATAEVSKPPAEATKATAEVTKPSAEVSKPSAEASSSTRPRPKPKPKAKPVADEDAMDVDQAAPTPPTVITVDDHDDNGYLDPDDSEYVEPQARVKKTKGKGKEKEKEKGQGKGKGKEKEKETGKDSKRPRSPTSSDFFAPDIEEVERPAKKPKADLKSNRAAEVQEGGGTSSSKNTAGTSAAPTTATSATTTSASTAAQTKEKRVTFNAPPPIDPNSPLGKKLARQATRLPIPDINDGRQTRSKSRTAAAQHETEEPDEPMVTPPYIRTSPPPNTLYKGVMYSTNGEATPIGTVVEENGTSAHYLIPPRAAPSAPRGGSSSSAAAAAPSSFPPPPASTAPPIDNNFNNLLGRYASLTQQVAEAQQRMTAASAAGTFTMDLADDPAADDVALMSQGERRGRRGRWGIDFGGGTAADVAEVAGANAV